MCEACHDSDSDWICEYNDNCPSDANADQLNSDSDSQWDVCDSDDDDDGVDDTDDCSPLDAQVSDLDLCGVCWWDDSSCEDCAWVPNWPKVIDSCGACLEPTDSQFNQGCIDCAWVPNGSSYEDQCGICDADSANDNTTCLDCNNEINGTAEEDACNICGGDGSTCTDSNNNGTPESNDPDDNDPCNPSDTVAACDTDNDGSPDGNDCDPNDATAQAEDMCGVCGGDGSTCDSDGDGVTDITDNCPNHSNPWQEDVNNDGIWDYCNYPTSTSWWGGGGSQPSLGESYNAPETQTGSEETLEIEIKVTDPVTCGENITWEVFGISDYSQIIVEVVVTKWDLSYIYELTPNSDGTYEIHLNYTDSTGEKYIEDGEWNIVYKATHSDGREASGSYTSILTDECDVARETAEQVLENVIITEEIIVPVERVEHNLVNQNTVDNDIAQWILDKKENQLQSENSKRSFIVPVSSPLILLDALPNTGVSLD